jgi:hypothetical protein
LQHSVIQHAAGITSSVSNLEDNNRMQRRYQPDIRF